MVMRLFVGVPIPQAMAEAVGEVCQTWARKLRSRVAWVRPALMHVTLKFLGEVPPAQVPATQSALEALAAPAFSLAPQGAGFFPSAARPRVFWLGFGEGAPELRNLAQGLEAALEPLGFAPETRPFTGHVTLARIKDAAPGDPWLQAAQAVAALQLPVFAVDRMVLWQSILGPQGPRYQPVREYLLSRG
jgi:2'-5' RNA ligase